MQSVNKIFTTRLQRGMVAGALLLMTLAGCVPASSTPLPEITVEINDNAFIAPAEMPAGLVAVTMNDQRSDPTDGVPIIARLHEGVTMEEALAEGDPTAPPKVTFLGGQVGRTIFKLEAGNYFIQWANEEGNRNPPPVPFTVQGAAGAGTEPKSDLQLNLVDFNFTLPDTVPSGKHLWQITNQGKTEHHALFLKLNEGASDDEFTTWLMQEEQTGPPPAQLVVHGAPLAPGVTNWAEIDLSPGIYYLVCFLPDFTQDPPLPHVAHGMLRRFTVQP